MKISHAILVCVALWGGVAASLLAQALVAERHEREREARLQGNGLAAIRNGPGELSPRPKPQLKPAAKLRPKSKRRPDAGAGTSRAAARASRRDPG